MVTSQLPNVSVYGHNGCASLSSNRNDKTCPPAATFSGAKLPPCEHLVQIYQEDDAFLDSLEGFVAGGLRSGDGVVVIATPSHTAALEDRLRAQGIDLATWRGMRIS